jgi:hypothetical protein
VVATGALAGCRTPGALSDGGTSSIRAHDLPGIDREADPERIVPPTVPVGIAPAHVDRVRSRVTELLSTLPTPMGPDDVPNGHVRRRLLDAAGDATTGLADAREAGTDLLALRILRRARAAARYAAAGWAVAERGRSVGPLRREHGRAVSAARSAAETHEYVGAEAVRAALVHARIETALARATDDDRVRSRGRGRLLTVAEWGETAESARAHLADARHLAARFATSLPSDAGTVEATLAGAAGTLFADVRSRRSALPPEPTADDPGVAERALDDLRWEAASGPARVGDAPGPARALVDANRGLARLRALDRLRTRIDDGEVARVGTAAGVRELRTAAYDALDAALAESPAPGMARTVVADAARRIAGADRRLARAEGEIRPARLDDPVADYHLATVLARAAPGACSQVLDVLDRAP